MSVRELRTWLVKLRDAGAQMEASAERAMREVGSNGLAKGPRLHQATRQVSEGQVVAAGRQAGLSEFRRLS